MQTQHEEAMKDEKEQHKAELANMAATHQQEMDQMKCEVDRLQTMNLEKDDKLLHLEQQKSSEIEVHRFVLKCNVTTCSLPKLHAPQIWG